MFVLYVHGIGVLSLVRVAGDGKWTGIWHMVGVDGQKFSWTYDELVQTLSKMFLMNNEKGLN